MSDSAPAKDSEGSVSMGNAEPARDGQADGVSGPESVSLAEQLQQAMEERDSYKDQYSNLLNKVTHMRQTLGDRLRQDAEELDRREQQIETLTSQNADLQTTLEQVKGELVNCNNETERVTAELDKLRVSASKTANAPDPAETSRLELRYRELQETVEALRADLDRWENAYMDERSRREEQQAHAQRMETARKEAEERESEQRQAAAQDKLVARQLQQTLEELQLSQERDLQRTVGEMQQQMESTESELETCKGRLAEMQEKLRESQAASERNTELEREVKEKNLFIGKLRQEAVILNEHLTEALRQIRRDSSDTLVDRRLVTNLFLQFLSVPRADSKRFEILRLIASVLHWNDEERGKAGLIRMSAASSALQALGIGYPGSSQSKASARQTSQGSSTGEDSMSNLFVEFLLSEAERGKAPNQEQARSASQVQGGQSTGGKEFDLHALENLDHGERHSAPEAQGKLGDSESERR